MSLHRTSESFESLLLSFAENSPAFLWTTDRELKITARHSGSTTQIQSSDGWVGRSISETFFVERPDSAILTAHRRALEGHLVPVELDLRGAVFRGCVGPLRETEGQIVGCIGIAHESAARLALENAEGTDASRYVELLSAITAYRYSVQFREGACASTFHSPGCVVTTGYAPVEFAVNPHLWFQMVHQDDREAVLRELDKVMRGERISPLEHRIRAKDGTTRWIRNTIVSHFDDSGKLLHYDGLVEDITERVLAEQSLQKHVRTQGVLNSLLTLSLEKQSLQECLEGALDILFSIPWLALESKGCVYLIEEDSQVLVMFAHRGMLVSQVERCHTVPVGRCLCGKAAAERKMLFRNCVNGQHEIRYAGMRPHGHFCLPIVSEAKLLGVLNLYVRHGHEKKPEEESFLIAVAHVLAGVIQRDRSERIRREREGQLLAAQRIQEHLLPPSAPNVPGLDIAGVLIPAEYAAGDHYDYLTLPDGALGVVVGDVTGHGFSSALLMAATSAHLRSFAEEHSNVQEILQHTNSVLRREVDEERFVTFLFLRMDLSSRRLSYVNGGHPPGYLLNSSGEIKTVFDRTDLPLVIASDSEFEMKGPISWASGDVILLITDGVLEAYSPTEGLFGEERMLEVVRTHIDCTAREIIAGIQKALHDFMQCNACQDDVTILILKVDPPCVPDDA